MKIEALENEWGFLFFYGFEGFGAIEDSKLLSLCLFVPEMRREDQKN